MGKRKRHQRAKLPLFDLPLNPGEADGGGTLLDDLPVQTSAQADPGVTPDAAAQEPPPVDDQSLPPVVAADSEATPVVSPAAAAPVAGSAPVAALEDKPSSESQLDLLDLAVRTEPSAATARSEGAESSTEAPDDKVRVGDRLLGGVADLAVQLLMLGVAVAATHALGVAVTSTDWMPFALLALAFSFLYWIVPLAFWGQTPGMAWVGHTARAPGGLPLSFGQTFLRWLGALLTLATAGLPLLLNFTGRSLSDRLSRSDTLPG